MLMFLLPDELRDCISGDLAEIYEAVVLPSSGIVRARLWYWRQVFFSMRLLLRFRTSPQTILEHWKGRVKMDMHPPCDIVYHPGIRIDRIQVSGIVGLVFVFATIVIFGVIPAVRVLAAIAGCLGIVGAGFLHSWRKRHAINIRSLDLHESGLGNGPGGAANLSGKEGQRP